MCTIMSAMPLPSPREDVLRGIVQMLISVSLFSAMYALAKETAERYPVFEVAFFRNSFALFPVGIMVLRNHGLKCLRTKRLGGHFTRSVIGMTSLTMLFWSYHLLPLADAVALSFSSPLFLTALSWPLLREKVGPHRWSAVALGFVGVVIMADPSGDMLNLGFVVSMIASVATACAMITIRQLGKTEAPVTTVFYFTMFSTLISCVALPFNWVTPTLPDLGLLAVMGFLGGTAQHFMTRAYALAPAAVIGPFNYAGIIWATLFGWMFWSDVPSAQVMGGAGIVICSGLYILYRETRRRRQAAEWQDNAHLPH